MNRHRVKTLFCLPSNPSNFLSSPLFFVLPAFDFLLVSQIMCLWNAGASHRGHTIHQSQSNIWHHRNQKQWTHHRIHLMWWYHLFHRVWNQKNGRCHWINTIPRPSYRNPFHVCHGRRCTQICTNVSRAVGHILATKRWIAHSGQWFTFCGQWIERCGVYIAQCKIFLLGFTKEHDATNTGVLAWQCVPLCVVQHWFGCEYCASQWTSVRSNQTYLRYRFGWLYFFWVVPVIDRCTRLQRSIGFGGRRGWFKSQFIGARHLWG